MLEKAYYKSPLVIVEIVGSELGNQQVKLKVDLTEPTKEFPEHIKNCADQLEEYFQGKRKEFNLKLDFNNAPKFYQQVWKALLEIPYGHTTSYGAIAERVNNPKAVRAVGLANRNNQIAFIVPCHRVIGKSGKLQGYFYGLETKRTLLQLENPMSFAEQGKLF